MKTTSGEKMAKTVHEVGSASKKEIAMLRGLGYTVVVTGPRDGVSGHFWIKANVNGNRFRTLRHGMA